MTPDPAHDGPHGPLTTATSAAADRVVLCAPDGTPTGTAARSLVHTHDTPLHRAFSVHLLDDQGRTLLTRRALSKVAWPGVWSNSCCGHPLPGESDEDAVHRRVRQELGAQVEDLRVVLPDFAYRAVDASGIVENEVCPVFVARLRPGTLRPDPAEVAETAWVDWADAVRTARLAPALLSPWAVLQLDALGPRTRALDRAPTPSAELTAARVQERLEGAVADLQTRWSKVLPADVAGPAVRDLGAWAGEAVLGGGKRLRPAMCHWGFVAAGGTEGPAHEAVVDAAAALELLHAFALVHDDVMDASATRRGRPTTHVRAEQALRADGGRGDGAVFGTSMAVLVGDLLHAEADRLAATLPDPVRAQWWELSVELVAGQGLDLAGAAARRCPLPSAQQVADLKSGAYTIARPLRLGAVAAGATAPTLDALGRYAAHLGRAFALRDDVLGLWGDPALTGKPAGDDLRERKPTVLRALALERLTGPDAQALERAGHLDADDQDVADALAVLERTGVLADVEAMIGTETDHALAALHDPAVAPPARDGLTDLAHRIAWRTA